MYSLARHFAPAGFGAVYFNVIQGRIGKLHSAMSASYSPKLIGGDPLIEARTRGIDQFAGGDTDRAGAGGNQCVGGGTMQMNAASQGLRRWPPLGDERRDDSGQNIAAAGTGEGRVAVGVDAQFTVW